MNKVMRRFAIYTITEHRTDSNKTVVHEGTLEQLVRDVLAPLVEKTKYIYVNWWRPRPIDPKKVKNINKFCITMSIAQDIMSLAYNFSTKYYTYHRKK